MSDPSNVFRNLYVVTSNSLGDREVVGQGDRWMFQLECSISNSPCTSQLTTSLSKSEGLGRGLLGKNQEKSCQATSTFRFFQSEYLDLAFELKH